MKNRHLMNYMLPALILLLVAPLHAVANPGKKISYFKHKEFRMRFSPNTPQQIHAFYEARGFPRAALETLKDKCFITVGLKNIGKNIVWADVSNWKFTVNNKPVKLYTRAEWKVHWNSLKVPLGVQSAFRWTQFPIKLDFRPDEAEGGNIVIPRTREAISFEGTFIVQQGKQQTPVTARVENLKCAFD